MSHAFIDRLTLLTIGVRAVFLGFFVGMLNSAAGCPEFESDVSQHCTGFFVGV